MMIRRFFLCTIACVLTVGMVLTGGVVKTAAADEFGDGAKVFIKVLADKAIASLTSKEISKKQRETRFRGLMLENFAIGGIAQFVLGRYWPRASDQEKAEYLKLFEDLMVTMYAERFSKYAGETLDIERTEVRNGNDALVYSEIKRVDATQPIKVAWRVRGKPGAYKIVDVIVEGISMAQTQKSEFASFIQQNGGKLDALFAEMRKRIQLST